MTTTTDRRPGWLSGNVDDIVEEIRADYAEAHAPFPHDTMSVSDHARIMGYRWIAAHLAQPETNYKTGRPDHAAARRKCAAVMAAVDRIIDERMAEIEAARARREAEKAAAENPCAGGRCVDPEAHAEGAHDQ